jgi:hypothetical protein
MKKWKNYKISFPTIVTDAEANVQVVLHILNQAGKKI